MVYLSMLESEEDKIKFEQIYVEYRQSLYLAALAILHDPEDAEDVVEDTFLTIANNFTEISKKERQKMRSYIVIINRNKAIDKYNAKKRDLEITVDIDCDEIVDASELNKYEYDELYSAIKELPQKYKDIIYLYDLMEMPAKSIANSLGITVDTVYKRVSRARAMLKSILERGDENDSG